MADTFEMTVLAETFVVSRLSPTEAVPSWAFADPGFVAVCRTDDELSVLCSEARTPAPAADTPRWRGVKVHGPFPFDTIGVLASLSRSLAEARISLLAVSTYDTDYIFVRTPDLARAVRALRHYGHTVHTPHSPTEP